MGIEWGQGGRKWGGEGVRDGGTAGDEMGSLHQVTDMSLGIVHYPVYQPPTAAMQMTTV